MRTSLAVLSICFVLTSASLQAQEDQPRVLEIPTITVQGSDDPLERRVVDRKIHTGKKSSAVPKSELPTTASNQYRQTLAQIPGLVVSEVNNESYASISSRGLGDPHESFNILMLRDGLPVTPDPYGYPAAYYIPPPEALDRVEFVRGGAGLLYGPQPGGALNWRLRKAPAGPQGLKFMTKALGGRNGQFNSFTEASVAGDDVGALGSFAARGSRGFRETNSDSAIINPRINTLWHTSDTSSLSFDFDYYQGRFGEPGGLALTPASGVYAMEDGAEKTTLANDRFEFDRVGAVISWDKDWSASLGAKTSLWVSQARRSSFRQSLGGAPAFGGRAVGTTNTIQEQNFQTFGADVRLLQKYDLFEDEQNLTIAVTAINTYSPYTQQTGATPFARSGAMTRDLVRKTNSVAVSVENAFKFGNVSLIPGIRAESIEQSIDENLNVGSSGPLRAAKKISKPVLGGLGVEYQLEASTVYANVSQGYKPPSFSDTVPLSTGDTISGDIKEAKTITTELGLRGRSHGIDADVSVFQIDFSDQFGRVGTEIRNVGRSKTEGAELTLSGSVVRGLKAYANATWLAAKFTGGPLDGKTPQYAPKEMYRAGLTWLYADKSSVSLQMQSMAEQFGDDANTDRFKIPSVTVWDVSGEHQMPKLGAIQDLRFNWGVQNLFNLKSYTRVRSNGVEPLQPLTLYAGLSLYL